MRALSRYIAGARARALPAAVAEKTKHHLLDTLGAMLSGSRLRPGQLAIARARTLGGARQAAVVGTRLLTDAPNAAQTNAMLAHADETDDSHAPSLTHPGCAVVAAALAMAERWRRSGAELLRAVALGYDLTARLCRALHPVGFRAVGHCTHSIGPTFGAAAAAAALAGLDAPRARYALSYAAQQASGISCYARDRDHVEKAFVFGGMPARNGVTAAAMAAAGFTGVEDVFSGERSFFLAFDESGRTGGAPDAGALVRGLGKSYEVLNADIKRWPVGSPIQAPLDSLLALMRSEGVRAEDLEALTVRVSRTGAETTDDRDMPDICMQHLCALMLLEGSVGFEAAHDRARMSDPRVLALRSRIRLVGDETLERLLPERHGVVELVLKDGRRLCHRTSAVRGTAQNPMSRAEVEEKCRDLAAPVLGSARAQVLCQALWRIERLSDVRALRPLLRP